MRRIPTWFGEGDVPLFGWVHIPDDDTARAGVVLCPSLSVEAMSAYPAYRMLADALAELGFIVLRFDYRGTGDSCGSLRQAAAAERWVDDVQRASSYLRDAGATEIAFVGMRLGAVLGAAAAASDGDIASLVLWDPMVSGRAFIREQTVLKMLSIGETPPVGEEGATELLGLVLDRAVVSALSAIDCSRLQGRLARRVLVLSREDRPIERKLKERLETESVTWSITHGQGALVDVLPDDAVLPYQTIQEIAGWLDAELPDERRPVDPTTTTSVVVESGARGDVFERPVEVSPLGLFAMLTEPADDTSAPTVIFSNAGLLHHIGPARLWVDLGRRLAGAGIRSLRLDLSGLGDSPERPGQARQVSYPAEAITDIACAARAASPEDPSNVIFAGLCAGAYHSIEAGITLSARAVCAINPILAFQPPQMSLDGAPGGQRQAVQPYNALFQRLRRYERLRKFGEAAIPASLWWFLDKTGLQPSPARGLETLDAAGIATLLVCGEYEALHLQRARWTMRRLSKSGRLRYETVIPSDHTLFGGYARERVVALLEEYVISRFGSDAVGELDSDLLPVSLPLAFRARSEA